MSTPAPPAGPHLSSMPFVIYPHHTPLVLVSLSPIPSWPFRTGSLSPSPRCTITSTGSRPTLLREQVGVHLNFNSTSLAALWEIDLREQSGREITWEATAPTQARDDCSLGTEGTMVMDWCWLGWKSNLKRSKTGLAGGLDGGEGAKSRMPPIFWLQQMGEWWWCSLGCGKLQEVQAWSEVGIRNSALDYLSSSCLLDSQGKIFSA